MPRFLHQLYAWLFGYFWLPCPRCGRMFGGHEWQFNGDHVMVDGRAMGTCGKCVPKNPMKGFTV